MAIARPRGQALARLQHTNVVPVYSVHDDGPVQVICMPYLGRVTIADLLREYRSDHSSRLLARREAVGPRGPHDHGGQQVGGPVRRRARRHPRHQTWTWDADGPPPIVGDPLQAVVQVLAQLAAGLEVPVGRVLSSS